MEEEEEQKQPLQEENNLNDNQDGHQMAAIIPDGAVNIANNENISKLCINGEKAGIRGNQPENTLAIAGNSVSLFQTIMLTEDDRKIYPFCTFGVVLNENNEVIATACLISPNMAITSSDKIKPFSKKNVENKQALRKQDSKNENSSPIKTTDELPMEKEEDEQGKDDEKSGKDLIGQMQEDLRQEEEEEQKLDIIDEQQQEKNVKNQDLHNQEGEVEMDVMNQEDQGNLQQQQPFHEQSDFQENQPKPQQLQGTLRFVNCGEKYQECIILSVKIISDSTPGIAVLELSKPFGEQSGWLASIANSNASIYNIHTSTNRLIIFSFTQQNDEFIATNLGLEVDKFKDKLTVSNKLIQFDSLLFTFDPEYGYSLIGFSCQSTFLKTTYNLFNNQILQNLERAIADDAQKYLFCETQNQPRKYLPNKFKLLSKNLVFTDQLEIEQQNKTLSAVSALVRVNETCIACAHKKGWLSVLDWTNGMQLFNCDLNSVGQQGNEQGNSSDQMDQQNNMNQEDRKPNVQNSFIGLITRGEFLFCLLERTIVCYSWLDRKEKYRINIDSVYHSCTRITEQPPNSQDNQNVTELNQKQQENQEPSDEDLQFQSEQPLKEQGELLQNQENESNDNAFQKGEQNLNNNNPNNVSNNTHQNHKNDCTFTCFCCDEEDQTLLVGCSAGCLLKFIYSQEFQGFIFQQEIANFSKQQEIEAEDSAVAAASATKIIEIVQIFKETRKYSSSFLIGLSSGELKILTNDWINQTAENTVLAFQEKEKQDYPLKQLLLLEDRTRVLAVSQQGYAIFVISHDEHSNVLLKQEKQVTLEEPIDKAILLNNDELGVIIGKNIAIYNIKNSKYMEKFKEENRPISSLGVLNSEGFISGSDEGLVKVWVLLFDQGATNTVQQQPRREVLDTILEDLSERSAQDHESKFWFSQSDFIGVIEEQKSQQKIEVVDQEINQAGSELKDQVEIKADEAVADAADEENNQHKEVMSNEIGVGQNLSENNDVLSHENGSKIQNEVEKQEEQQKNGSEIAMHLDESAKPQKEEEKEDEEEEEKEDEIEEEKEDGVDQQDSDRKIENQENIKEFDEIEEVKEDVLEGKKSQQQNETKTNEQEVVSANAKNKGKDVVIASQKLLDLLKQSKEKQKIMPDFNNQLNKLIIEDGKSENQPIKSTESKDNRDKQLINNAARNFQAKDQQVFVQKKKEMKMDLGKAVNEKRAIKIEEIPENKHNEELSRSGDQKVPSTLVQSNNSQKDSSQNQPGFEQVNEALRIATKENERLEKQFQEITRNFSDLCQEKEQNDEQLLFYHRLTKQLKSALLSIQTLEASLTEIKKCNTNIYHIPEQQRYMRSQQNCQPLLISKYEEEILAKENLKRKNEALKQIILDMQKQLEFFIQNQLDLYAKIPTSKVDNISQKQYLSPHSTLTSTPNKIDMNNTSSGKKYGYSQFSEPKCENKLNILEKQIQYQPNQQLQKCNRITHLHQEFEDKRQLDNHSSYLNNYHKKNHCQRHQNNPVNSRLLSPSSGTQQSPKQYQFPFINSSYEHSPQVWQSPNEKNVTDAQYYQKTYCISPRNDFSQNKQLKTPEKIQRYQLPSDQSPYYSSDLDKEINDYLRINGYRKQSEMYSGQRIVSYNPRIEQFNQPNKYLNSQQIDPFYQSPRKSPRDQIIHIKSSDEPPQCHQFLQKQSQKRNYY